MVDVRNCAIDRAPINSLERYPLLVSSLLYGLQPGISAGMLQKEEMTECSPAGLERFVYRIATIEPFIAATLLRMSTARRLSSLARSSLAVRPQP
jgi:hypothetical protein